MVALLDNGKGAGAARIEGWLRDADFPGEEKDHRWMAERLLNIVEEMDPGEADSDMPHLLTAGLLRGFGLAHLTPSPWPEPLLCAVRPLLQSGFPPLAWGLVRRGVLHYAGEPWGDSPRWRLDGSRIAPLLNEWHELGEHLVFRRIAESLRPLLLSHDKPLQITLTGVDRAQGRRWLKALGEALRDCNAPDAHLMLG